MAVPATPSSYLEGGNTYSWGQGNDLILSSVEVGANIFIYDGTLIPTINLLRVDNTLSTGFRTRLFVERIDDFNFNASLPAADINGSRVVDGLLQPILNRGVIDLFTMLMGHFSKMQIILKGLMFYIPL